MKWNLVFFRFGSVPSGASSGISVGFLLYFGVLNLTFIGTSLNKISVLDLYSLVCRSFKSSLIALVRLPQISRYYADEDWGWHRF